MIIPSIDLMSGRAVQLRQGREHVLTDPREPEVLCAEFNRYGEVAVIDLDAALGQGDNLDLLRRLCRVADVRAGGGIRDLARARALLRAGARKIIIGTAADPDLLARLPRDRVIVALDHIGGEVVDQGWRHGTGEPLLDRARRLAPYCAGYLCTFVENEGGLGGLSADAAAALAEALPHPVTVAGGVASTADAVAIARRSIDVQVGMALYTGRLDLADGVAESVAFERGTGDPPILPTIVQDRSGQVLMLAYSSPESLREALRRGQGIYYSRSRQALWVKGETSGHGQRLISCRPDCDRDSLLFTVEQTGPACHTGRHSCFSDRRFSLSALFETLRQRRQERPEGSYTASLFQDRERLLRKLMEEAFEVTRARGRDDVVWELADAIFFLSVLAVDEEVDVADITAELGGRER